MRLSNIHWIILDLTVEDSFALPEIVSQIRGSVPHPPAAIAKQNARQAIVDLLRAGLVELTRLQSVAEEEETLDMHAAEDALADESSWIALSGDQPHVRVVATDVGQQVYDEQG